MMILPSLLVAHTRAQLQCLISKRAVGLSLKDQPRQGFQILLTIAPSGSFGRVPMTGIFIVLIRFLYKLMAHLNHLEIYRNTAHKDFQSFTFKIQSTVHLKLFLNQESLGVSA